LGAIDTKYDVAILTACPQLENILVDSVDTDSECIRYLKANNLLQTSFVALNKQDKNARKMTIPKTFQENALRLFDLIKFTDQQMPRCPRFGEP
jgi:structural maintenance of chromosome 4